MPKRKISSGPQQLDCSDGAKMLIDQMKEHPEEFRGYEGKFAGMLDMAQQVVRNATRNMSKRDATAVLAAAETHLYEVWLAEDVLTSIMQPKPELNEDAHRAYAVGHGLTANLAQGTVLLNNQHLYSDSVQNAQIQKVNMERLQMEKYKYDMEREESRRFNEALGRQNRFWK